MSRVLASALLCLLLGQVVTTAPVRAVEVPPPGQRVTDLSGTLSADERAGIETRLQRLEQEKGSQIALLLVPTTAPEAIEAYALRVAESWRLGREGVDDGVLLLVAVDDRKMRIEVGYGLEGVIPDAIARRVIAETIAPYFRRQDFAGGLRAGVERLAALVEGEPLPQARRPESDHGQGRFPALMPLAFLLFPFVPLLSRALGRLPGAMLSGALMGAIGYLALGPLAGLLIGLFGFVVALNAGVGLDGGRRRHRPRSPADFGGVHTGGRGGGFGGRGGGFGGGGASGSW